MVRNVHLHKHLLVGALLVAIALIVGFSSVSAQVVDPGANNVVSKANPEWEAEFRILINDCHESLMSAKRDDGTRMQPIAQCKEKLQPLLAEYQAKTSTYVQSLQALHKEQMEAKRAEIKTQIAAKRAEFEARREARFAEFCERYNLAQGAPTGFGSPFEVAGDKDKLIGLRCDKLTGDVAVDVGDGEQTTYVYEKGYIYDKANKKWKEMTFNGENKSGTWFVGDAFADVDLEDDATSPDQSTWVLGYTCSKESGSWKCGCKDAACTQPGWQIQQIER
jgi:hypothetical protein